MMFIRFFYVLSFYFQIKLEKFEVEGTLCEDGVIGNDALELVFPTHLANLGKEK